MMRVKLISGAYGENVNGKVRTRVKGDIFSVSEDEAKRLVSLKVAEFADSEVATDDNGDFANEIGNNEPENENAAQPVFGLDTPVGELRELAKSVGISFKFGTTKEEMVSTLSDYFYGDEESDEDAPVLSPEEPQ